jgi:hypothetical protein
MPKTTILATKPTKHGARVSYLTAIGEVMVTKEQHSFRNGSEEINYKVVTEWTDNKGVITKYPEPRNEFEGFIETSRKDLIREKYEIASEFGLTIA